MLFRPLAIHTNNLILGNGSNSNSAYIYGGNVTIDDNGGVVFTTTGLLTVTAGDSLNEFIRSSGSPLSISATASANSSLLLTSNGIPGTTLELDGDNGSGNFGVALTANNSITIGPNTPVGRYDSVGNWIITSPTVTFDDGGMIDIETHGGRSNITVHTNTLNLGDGSNGNGVGIYGDAVVIDDNGSAVFSTTGLTINLADAGQMQRLSEGSSTID